MGILRVPLAAPPGACLEDSCAKKNSLYAEEELTVLRV